MRKKAFENDPYATKTSIKGKVKPIVEEMTVLRGQLYEYEYIRDAKIPDHEKLPKTCIYYKHYMQVEKNSKVIEAARAQIKDDKELLEEIA